MRAGAVSTAALKARVRLTPPLVPQHCSEAEYAEFLDTLPVTRGYYNHRLELCGCARTTPVRAKR